MTESPKKTTAPELRGKTAARKLKLIAAAIGATLLIFAHLASVFQVFGIPNIWFVFDWIGKDLVDITKTPASNAPLIAIFWPAYLLALWKTVVVAFFSILLGTSLGCVLALFLTRRGNNVSSTGWAAGIWKALCWLINCYVWIFLALPALAVLVMMYHSGSLSYFNSTIIAILALGINLSPFVTRIVVSGIQNIPKAQLDAATAFGYDSWEVALRFKLPLVRHYSMQAILVQWLTTLKLSSLASVIGVMEVLNRSEQIIRETYRTEEAYFWLIVCYAAIVFPLLIFAGKYDRLLKDMRPN
jgi:polar amino acid transport system permease protein